MPKLLWQNFWAWYERYYTVNVALSSLLFLLQIFHLYWLTTAVVTPKAFGVYFFFSESRILETIIALIDYSEIPAIVAVSLIYINELRHGFSWRPILFLTLLNSQWFHIFWITDEFLIENFIGSARTTILPSSLAWLAIIIDYFEAPIMIDAIRRSVDLLLKRPLKSSILPE